LNISKENCPIFQQVKAKKMSFSGVNMKAVEASYKASLRIATAGKSHTTGESLLLPATKDKSGFGRESSKTT
jgi:hypothetical protein